MKKMMILLALVAGLAAPLHASEKAVGNKCGFSPFTCNGTPSAVSMTACHANTVSLTNGVAIRLDAGPVQMEAASSSTAAVEESGCVTTQVAPGKCIYFKYYYQCETYQVGYWPMKHIVTVCDYLGSELKCSIGPPDHS